MWPLAALIGLPACHSNRRQPIRCFCPFHIRFAGQPVLLSNMSAAPVFPMCVRASRALLRLRSGAVAASSPAVVDTVRTLSTDKPPAGTGGATGGLAQAILQERLQQQQQSQVGQLACLCALDLCHQCWRGERVHCNCETPPTGAAHVNQIEATLTFPAPG